MIIFLIVLSVIVVLLLAYLIGIHRAIHDISDQISELTNEETNQIVRNKSGLKILNPLISAVNNGIIRLRKKVFHANQTTREVRETLTEISHDLRTPLTAASGYTGMLKNIDLTDEEKLHYIEIIEERFETTRRLVDQLFYYTRLESDALGWNETVVDIRKVLTSILAAFYGQFESHNYDLNVDIDDEAMNVLGDEDAIKRIYSNIISNGIVHGEGDFSTSLKSVNEDYYRFEFSNRATKISERDAGHIFERYYTANKERSQIHAGLGLAISKELTLKMDGTCGAYLKDEILTVFVELKKYK